MFLGVWLAKQFDEVEHGTEEKNKM